MNRKLTAVLVYTGLILTPVFGLQELLSALGTLSGGADRGPGLLIRAAKDLLLMVILMLFLIDVLRGEKVIKNMFVWLMVAIIFVSFVFTFLTVSPLLAVLGLRAFSSFVFIFVSYKYFSMKTIGVITKVLSFVLILEFFAASAQALYGVPLEGTTYFGLAARPFGTFTHPWSFAVFICVVLCFRMGYDLFQYGALSKRTRVYIAVSTIFVFLAGSGAGLITLLIILLGYFLLFSRIHPFLKAGVLPVVLLIPFIAFVNLVMLTGRQAIFRSMQGRINVFMKLIDTSTIKDIIIGKGLGIGSNSTLAFSKMHTLATSDADMLFVADALVTSLISQAGVIFLFLFVAFNIYLFMRAFQNRYQGVNTIALFLIPAVMVASLGNNIIELYPVNWLLFIVYGLALRKNFGQTNVEGPASEINQGYPLRLGAAV